MSQTRGFRISVCCVVLVGLLAGGLGIRFGIRHRHDGGGTAHSHAAPSKRNGTEAKPHSHADNHSHVHSHASDHSHPHAHTHAHSHAHSHTDSHSHSHSHAPAHTHEDPGHSHESSDGAHVHVTFLGFELTLPDWFPGEPAPLYSESVQDRAEAPAGNVIELPGSFGLASFLQMFMDQTAIRPESPLIGGSELPPAITVQHQDTNLGLDPAPPIVPPPRLV